MSYKVTKVVGSLKLHSCHFRQSWIMFHFVLIQSMDHVSLKNCSYATSPTVHDECGYMRGFYEQLCCALSSFMNASCSILSSIKSKHKLANSLCIWNNCCCMHSNFGFCWRQIVELLFTQKPISHHLFGHYTFSFDSLIIYSLAFTSAFVL